jgi:hypothetical protein
VELERPALAATSRLLPFAVGTPVTRRPPHRSQRAELPHWAPTSGVDAQTLRLPYPFQRNLQAMGIGVGTTSWPCPRFLVACPFRVGHIDSRPGTVSGAWFAKTDSPWSGRLAPRPPPTAAHRSRCSSASQLLSACQTSRLRASLPCSFRIRSADLETFPRPEAGSPGSRVSNFRTCTGSSDHAGAETLLQITNDPMLPSGPTTPSAPRS